MSTPATYEIEGYIFYCHYDGHPIGAAQKFARMIDAHTLPAGDEALGRSLYADVRGGLAFAFVRANADAEQPFGNRRVGTRSDYHYALSLEDNGQIIVQVERRTERCTWQIVDLEELATWIDRQRTDLCERIAHAHASILANGESAEEQALVILPVLVRADIVDRIGRAYARYATRSAAEAIVRASGRRIDGSPDSPPADRELIAWSRALCRRVSSLTRSRCPA